jgi:HAD superfamily phosphatase (TIGR01681 family)
MNNHINLEKFYETKKMFLFDLDDTLVTLDNNSKISTKEYKENLIIFLKKLKNSGKILGIVSWNKDPCRYMERYMPDIFPLFEKENILGPIKIKDLDELHNPKYKNKSYTIYHDTIVVYKSKCEMIKGLTDKYHLSFDDIIYFDDNQFHIKLCMEQSITSILVDPKIGIQFK